jgi:hypothetical protein
MYEELTILKSHIRNIETSNVNLRSKLGNFEEKKYNLMKLATLNEKDKSKLNEIFRKKCFIFFINNRNMNKLTYL